MIDATGADVTPAGIDFVGIASEGLYRVWSGRKQGYMDGAGRVVITPQFDQAREFSDGLAAVWVAGKYGYVNRQARSSSRRSGRWPTTSSTGAPP